MKYWCCAFSIGVISVSFLPKLPSLLLALSAILLSTTLWFVANKITQRVFIRYASITLVGFFSGAGYGIYSGHNLIGQQLPENMSGDQFWITGIILGLPETDERRQLFEVGVITASSQPDGAALAQFPSEKILVSSYGPLRVKSGETWELQVKLKPSRGFVNPGGFDYQASLLRRGIGATGYVRESTGNRLIKPQPQASLLVLRYQLQQWLIAHSHSTEKAILIALLVGDTSLISKDQWSEFTKTGTNHLIAISGLHLGFFAIVGFFLGELLGRCIQLLWHKCPAAVPGHLFAMAFTLFYSLVAGMNIPTLRTLIMLGVIHLVCLSRRSILISNVFFLALVCVLIYDPLAAFDMGFWLSFGAVGVLLFCFSGRLNPSSSQPHLVTRTLKEFVKSQWLMFIGLLVPLILLVNSLSLLAPIANVIAIPLITFFVVPCLIIAAIFYQVFGQADTLFLLGAEWGTELFRHWLQYLVQLELDQLNPSMTLNKHAVALAMVGVGLLLLPKGLRKPALGIAAICLALAIPLESGTPLQLLVFDVGQGTAVLVRTQQHQLLYDTGPAFTDNFDAGSGILTPYLRSQGIGKLDALIVSHNDADHSGGMEAVLKNFDIERLMLGEPEKHPVSPNQPIAENCHGVGDWLWDDVKFHFLEWDALQDTKSNNRSCVLLIEYQAQKILLPGDIEKPVERQLLAQKVLTPVTILLAPHHGSHSSSTPGFIAETYPQYVIYSTGYHNQHGHPHQDVRERYQHVNARELNTAQSGALEFKWSLGHWTIAEYRDLQKRYWFSEPQD